MALIVQKYGGTSVADPDRIRAVADNVAFTKKRGNDVIVGAPYYDVGNHWEGRAYLYLG